MTNTKDTTPTMTNKLGKPFKQRTAYGLCFKVKPNTALSTLLLELLEPILDRCHLCGEPAVRVGVYRVNMPYSDKDGTEYRALCARHKNFGIWTNADTAWGWS